MLWQRRSHGPFIRYRKLTLEPLESRALLSVTTSFDGTELRVTCASAGPNGDTVALGDDAGVVTVNGVPVLYGSPPIGASVFDVHEIVVIGSPFDDQIDAQNVNSQWGAGQIVINLEGNDGIDTIYG